MFSMDRASQSDPDVPAILEAIYDAIDPTVTGKNYYPAPENVLRFLRMEAPVKYCIIGMDPYPSFNERDGIPIATGRSFEVSELYGQGWDYKIKQASLRNMLKAIYYNETGTNPQLSVIRDEIVSGAFDILPPTDWFGAMEVPGKTHSVPRADGLCLHALGKQRPDRSSRLPERHGKDHSGPDRPSPPHGGVCHREHVPGRDRRQLDRSGVKK